MKINNINSRDLKKILVLEEENFKGNAFSRDLMEKLIKRSIFFLKLEDAKFKDEIIGFIIVIRDRIDRVNIINLLINRKFQNQGYGTLLLEKTLEKIRQLRAIKTVVLNVQVSNYSAIKLYEKFNFRKDPRELENYYQSGENAFLMKLDINSL
ncbi:MAG: GNAT family N-acetyltransferase [Candidatus Lokiarchaeota archaeon]|nr:GNAT family N-acetyltransferase [Candidatus Lokiarchaeota archaeon]